MSDKWLQAFFNGRVIQTRITAPMKAAIIEPMIPPPGQILTIPNTQPSTTATGDAEDIVINLKTQTVASL